MLIFTIIIGVIALVVLWKTIFAEDEFGKILGLCSIGCLIFFWLIIFSDYKEYEDNKGKDIYLVSSNIVMINPKIENGTYTVGDCSIKSETGATKINAELLLKLGSKVTILK